MLRMEIFEGKLGMISWVSLLGVDIMDAFKFFVGMNLKESK